MSNIIVIDFRSYMPDRAGKGVYTAKMTEALFKIDPHSIYILVGSDAPLHFDDYPNCRFVFLEEHGIYSHFEISRICQAYRADFFFSPTSYLTPLTIKSSTKVVLTVHDLISFLHPQGHSLKATIIEKLTLKKAIKRAHKILTVSNNTKKDLLDLFPDIKDKVITAHCDSGHSHKQVSIPDKHDNFFLAVGTIIPRKNYLNLIRAFHLLHQKHPHIRLEIIGKKGWKSRTVLKEIEKLGLQNHVKILGYLDQKELIHKYRAAIALVFPSFYEGFGIPPLEAMQSACPVICSHTSSLPEVAGKAAIFVDPHSIDQLYQAMNQLVQDPQKRLSLIKNGFEQFKKFSWEKSARLLLEIFKPKEHNQNQ